VPIYDYVCANGHTTEVIHGVNDAGPASCPVCGAPLRKALSAPTIHFKGSGWAKKERSSKPANTKSGDGEKSGDREKSGTPTATGSGEPAKAEPSKPAGPAASEA
jgi:putative FmdB family regulatory protein